jgi:hypothetical protein
MTALAEYGYNRRLRRYQHLASGRLVAESAVRAATDVVIDVETAKLREVSQRLVDGKINLAEWQLQMKDTVKRLHTAAGLAAFGGAKQASNSDLGYLGSLLKEQYQYLRDFAKSIRTGSQPLDGSLVARAALYAQGARCTHETVRQRLAQEAGQSQERSILAPADHCDQCVGEARKGWSPIGSLIPIGQRTCLARCRCTMTYR